jgi:photosystem II protein PsbQ
MSLFRPLISVLLALVAVFVVSCSSGDIKPPTYTSIQLEQIAKANSGVNQLRDRFPELAALIQTRNWNNVKTFIHGPLGELRARMSNLSRSLLPDDQPNALAASREVFGHLNKIDDAATNNDYTLAIRNYAEALKDFDKFSSYLPQQ